MKNEKALAPLSISIVIIILLQIALGVGNNIFVMVPDWYGVVLSLLRLKTKNCYATVLAHGVLNLFMI